MSALPHRRLIGCLAGFLLVPLLSAMLLGWSFLVVPGEPPSREYGYRQGDRVNPFAQFDFENGKWAAFVVLTWDDRRRLPKGIPNASVLTTTQPAVLSLLKSHLQFTAIGGDVATVTSQLLLFHNGNPVFETGIAIDPSGGGLQSRDFGWLDVTGQGSLQTVLSRFDRVWYPIVWP